MRKIIILTIVLVVVLACIAGCATKGNALDSDKMTVAVSIAPEATFVEKVAGDLVNIVTIIPPGNSPANYQPTTTEMLALSNATIYFVMQVPTEEANILPKIKDFNKDIILVNLREAVSKEYVVDLLDAHDDAKEVDDKKLSTVDPHIWLSPRRVVVMINTIAKELIKLDASNESAYRQNAKDYIDELIALDEEIKTLVEHMDNQSFMIYHGSYGYFALDYGLNMISLEVDGKAASAATMQQAIDQARQQGISRIYYQDEFDDNQAKTIAEEIDGVVVKAQPLSGDYIASLRAFATALTDQGE